MGYGYDVYVQVDLKSRVTAVNSSAFISDYTSWVLIESNVQGDKGHHAQGNYFPQPIMTEQGVYRYKLVEVIHNGGVWLSGVDNNVWEPGAPGVYDNVWKRVSDA